ncbi:extracellular solute-binding protein [Streptomyces sp. NPDC056817]|uniref:extracellular solute-binding protein n=1 Tax=Streptomyces sp. NPDC056817 TaxID=3345950 RepID=UPI0036C01F25
MADGVHGAWSRRNFLTTALGAGVAAPALAGLAGCGNNSGPLAGGSADGKVTELVVPTARTPWLDSYRRIGARYQQETGVRITLKEFPFDGLLTQQTNAIRNRSGAFDLFQINEGQTGQYYANGWVKPLTDIDAGFTRDQQVLDYDGVGEWDAQRKVTAPGGQLMGIPINGNIQLLLYRKDLYDQLGLAVPKTFDEALANGRTAQQSGKVKYGFVTRGQGASGGYAVGFDFGPVLHGYGGDWFVKPGEDWTPRINDSVGLAALERFLDLLKLGPPQPQTVGQAEVISLMQSGQALQALVVAAAGPQVEDPEKSQVAGKVGYAPVPAGPVGRVAMTGTWVLGVPADAKPERAKAALEFIRWLVSKEPMTAWAKDGGTPTRADVLAMDPGDAPNLKYLKAITDSVNNLHGGLRYTFSTQMLRVIEPTLSEVVAGKVAPKAGLDRIADELRRIIDDAGLAK